VKRAGERAVAADDDEPIHFVLTENLSRTVADLALMKLLAPRRAEHRAALAQDPGDIAWHQRHQRVVEEAAVTALDPDDVGARGSPDQGDGTNGRIHAGGVATTGQDRDALHGSDATVRAWSESNGQGRS
jgi:hypothetical protein